MKKELGMKNNGAIRKLMIMVLLSIFGSYCVGSEQSDNVEKSYFDSMKSSVSSMVESMSMYCQKTWSDTVSKFRSMFGNDQLVEIQRVNLGRKKLSARHDNDFDTSHGYYSKCTDGQKDCYFNEEFFDDTYFTGRLDLDPATSLDLEADPISFKKSRYSK